MPVHFSVVIIGGGAAGFFAALAAKDASPSQEVAILEKTSLLLSKVRISGGGRCNVTHACFDPKELVKNYPRGQRELLGPFFRFQPNETIQWFASRKVALKTEEDGRMFPSTDSSSTIIDCLLAEAKKTGVHIFTKTSAEKVELSENGFLITLNEGKQIHCNKLILATGSHPSGAALAAQFGHSAQPPVPSLFTFNVPASPLKELSGIVVDPVELRLEKTDFLQQGPLLVTHWGFSGPCALKLSAWAARYLKEKNYHTTLLVDWLPRTSKDAVLQTLKVLKSQKPSQTLGNLCPWELPKKLWKKFLHLAAMEEKRLSALSHEELQILSVKLKADPYLIEGKTTNKEEFVTCGGITLSEINFKTMESKLCKGLFFAGEILDIDAVTGGFNFQNAWTTGWIAGH